MIYANNYKRIQAKLA